MHDCKQVLKSLLGEDHAKILLVVNGVNKNYRVECSRGDFYARFSPETLHARHELQFEALTLSTLSKLSAPSCTPFNINEGSVHGPYEVHGVWYNVLLTNTIAGTSVSSNELEFLSFGKSLALIHLVQMDRGLSFQDRFGTPEIQKGPFYDVSKSILEYIDSCESQDYEVTICHGDAWPGNAINHNGVLTLFDFEYVHLGNPLYDIGTFAWYLLSEYNASSRKLFESFLKGYNSRRQLLLRDSAIRQNIALKDLHTLSFLSNFIDLTDEIIDFTVSMSRAMLSKLVKSDVPLF